MERITLNARLREDTGKGAARALRRGGNIPAIIMRRGTSSSITLNVKDFIGYLRKAAGNKVLVNMQFPDNTSRLTLVKGYHVHPVHGAILHADFQEVALDEKVKLFVHVNLVGEAIGVKRDKGVLQQTLREVEVQCLPNDIPGHIDLDISKLMAGQTYHVSDLVVPENTEVITDKTDVICQIIGQAALDAADAAAAAAAAATEPASATPAEGGEA